MSSNRNKVILLYVSSLMAIVGGVLSSVINTNYLEPKPYGDVRYVQNVINFMSSLMLFGYFLSGSRLLALSNNEDRSRSIRGAMVIILFISTIILMIGVIANYFFHISTPSVSSLFLVSLPVCSFPLLSNYVNTTAQGDNHIGRLSVARIGPFLIYVPLAYFVFENYGASSTNMMLIQWGSYTIVLLLIVISTHPTFNNMKSIMAELNDENKRYGLQLYYGSIVMLATNYIGGVTLGLFNEDNTNVGFYTLALTITSPLSMLPAIVGTTYFKQFATINKIPQKVITTTILLSLFSCFFFIITIQPIVKFIYSESYSKVGDYASWMAVGFCIHGIGDMLNRFLGSHGLGIPIRNSSIACGIIRVIGFVVLVYYLDVTGAIITTILSSFVYAIMLIVFYLNKIKEFDKQE